MTKTKSTKRALLMSALALLMCVSMLIGSTFAWFTDSVTSGNNIIKAGNLDVVLEYSTDGDTWNTVDATTKVFNDKALWEPGHREVVMFRVRNAGTLHLKYEMLTTVIEEKSSVNVYGEDFKLSDYLTLEAFCYGKDALGFDAMVDNFFASRTPWFIMEEFEFGKNMNVASTSQEMAPGFEHYYFVAITMPETVGNEANYAAGNEAPYINFAINLVATQYTVESDSFDNQYDKDATYPEIIAAEDLAAELAPVDGVISIDKDYIVTGEWTSIDVNGKTVTIDGNGHTISNLNKPLVAGDAGGNLTIKNLTIADSNIGTAADENGLGTGAFACFKDFAGNVTFENCHLVNSTVTSEEYRAGGLIGYISGGELTITDCSVVNCEITGVEGAAGLVAYTQVNTTITNSKVESTNITATEDRLGTKAPVAGAVVGTASGDAVVTLTNVEVANNTVSNNNATAVYSEMIGRLALNATAVVK